VRRGIVGTVWSMIVVNSVWSVQWDHDGLARCGVMIGWFDGAWCEVMIVDCCANKSVKDELVR